MVERTDRREVSKSLAENLKRLRKQGWTEDELRSYERGWHKEPMNGEKRNGKT